MQKSHGKNVVKADQTKVVGNPKAHAAGGADEHDGDLVIVSNHGRRAALDDGSAKEIASRGERRVVAGDELNPLLPCRRQQCLVALGYAVVAEIGGPRVGVGEFLVAELNQMHYGALHAHQIVGEDVRGRPAHALVYADVWNAPPVQLDHDLRL